MATKTTVRLGTAVAPKKHYCHCKEEATPVMIMPGRHMKFNCCNGHSLKKNETIKK